MTLPTTVGKAWLMQAGRRLDASFSRIKHCVDQLDDTQVWWRPQESMNSIGNILLHLCGNLKQWIIAGVREEHDDRDRPREFSERGPIPKGELLGRLEKIVHEAHKVLAELPEDELLAMRRIQGFDEPVLAALVDSLSHLAGHTQEIIYITRLQLGDKYRFAWVPATPEQGAPA